MHPVVIVCDTLEILGTVILLTLLITASTPSSKIRRAPTWYMFIFSTFFSNASTLLILGHQTGKAPNNSLCLTQAALIYSSAVYVAFSAAAFILQIYLTMVSIENIHLFPFVKCFLLYILPALASISILISTLVIGIQDPNSIQRADSAGIRCSLVGHSLTKIAAGVGIAGIAIALILEAIIALKLRTSWRKYETTLTESGNSPNVLVRVFIFTLLAWILFGVGLLTLVQSLKSNKVVNATYDIVIASLPAGAGIVFGTQRDILSVLGIWKRQTSESLEAQSMSPIHAK